MNKITLTVPVIFGLEALTANEIRALGYEVTAVEDGRVTFEGDEEAICIANINLRTGERVLVKMGEFPARTFDELFEGVKALDWSAWIGKNDAFPVKGYSIKSQLHSIPDCQAIVKKAIVEHMKGKYSLNVFPEMGARYQVQFSIMKDTATLYLDSTGDSLYKRGYRIKGNAAPIRETLAAALVNISRWRGDARPLFDPMCGSGTIPIEAVMSALNIAPGAKRSFAADGWARISKSTWNSAREEAHDNIIKDIKPRVFASDIDRECVNLAMQNAKSAGVSSYIRFGCGDMNKLKPYADKCTIICNPPYGERMLDRKKAEELYQQMGNKFSQFPQASVYVITSHTEFEKFYGKTADKRRKIYNGMIKCNLYQYFGRKQDD